MEMLMFRSGGNGSGEGMRIGIETRGRFSIKVNGFRLGGGRTQDLGI